MERMVGKKFSIFNFQFSIRSIRKLIKIWLLIASRVAQIQLMTGWGGFAFLLGKIIRFLFFFVFIFSVLSKTRSLVGYSREQVVLFFLVFNLIDISTQALFRGVYQFRRLVVEGDYDFDLLRPLPSFFRPIFGWTDILDIITLIPLGIYFWLFVVRNNLFVNSASVLIFILLFANSLVLGFSLHLAICAVCVLTTEIDHLIWIYRDVTNTGRFPTDIYSKGIQYFLTFGVPVIILMTIPAEALLGLLTWRGMMLSIVVTAVFFLLSWKFWRYSLSRYTSASS